MSCQHHFVTLKFRPESEIEIKELCNKLAAQIEAKIDEGGPLSWAASIDDNQKAIIINALFMTAADLEFHQKNILEMSKPMFPHLTEKPNTEISYPFLMVKRAKVATQGAIHIHAMFEGLDNRTDLLKSFAHRFADAFMEKDDRGPLSWSVGMSADKKSIHLRTLFADEADLQAHQVTMNAFVASFIQEHGEVTKPPIDHVAYPFVVVLSPKKLGPYDPRDPAGHKAFQFKRIDVNGDGYLSLDELFEGMKNAGMTQDQVSELFDKLDQNRDGKISIEEFIDAMDEPLSGSKTVMD